MLLEEIINHNTLLLEFGSRGFPGNGQGLFTRLACEKLANWVSSDVDDSVRPIILDWLCDVLKKDNGRFNEKLFREYVADGRYAYKTYTFQQRHLYFLAHYISQLPEQQRYYVAASMGKMLAGTNYNFQYKYWWPECGVPEEYRG